MALAGLADAAAAGDRAALDALVRAYPDYLAGYDATELIWRDGTRMPLSGGRPAENLDEMLRHGSILDQIRLPYTAGPTAAAPGPDDDPGQVRNRAFFDKMYGDCWKGEVAPRLMPVVWLPRSWGHTIRVTSVNGVAERLAAVSEELDALPDAVKRYAYPPAGTYNCRAVADTGQPSMHAWGAAIDINTAHSDYWLVAQLGDDRQRIRQSDTGRDRRDLRATWVHLGRQVVALRHDALRVPARAAQRPACVRAVDRPLRRPSPEHGRALAALDAARAPLTVREGHIS